MGAAPTAKRPERLDAAMVKAAKEKLRAAVGKLPRMVETEVKMVGGMEKCLGAMVEAWAKGLDSACLACPKCRFPHLDEGAWVKEHYVHTCLDCGAKHKVDAQLCGNPLAAAVGNK